MIIDAISFKIDEAPSIFPSPNMFAVKVFNVHNKDWLTYTTAICRTGKLCDNFSISVDLTHMVNFLNWLSDCHSHSLVLLDLFLFLVPVFVLQWTSLSWVILMILLFQVKFTFHPTQKADAMLNWVAYHQSRVDWDGHLRDFP